MPNSILHRTWKSAYTEWIRDLVRFFIDLVRIQTINWWHTLNFHRMIYANANWLRSVYNFFCSFCSSQHNLSLPLFFFWLWTVAFFPMRVHRFPLIIRRRRVAWTERLLGLAHVCTMCENTHAHTLTYMYQGKVSTKHKIGKLGVLSVTVRLAVWSCLCTLTHTQTHTRNSHADCTAYPNKMVYAQKLNHLQNGLKTSCTLMNFQWMSHIFSQRPGMSLSIWRTRRICITIEIYDTARLRYRGQLDESTEKDQHTHKHTRARTWSPVCISRRWYRFNYYSLSVDHRANNAILYI